LKQKEYDTVALSRSISGHKPNKLRAEEGGDIDGSYAGKNAWDDAVRSLVPRILDLSVIEWEGQKTTAIQKLRDALDADFEYVGCELSYRGYWNAIQRFMKTERSRLKTQFMAGETKCPIYIDPGEWEKLWLYWGSSHQKEKAERMAKARK
jgi:hypothetical protein